jgi:hypothetical protein
MSDFPEKRAFWIFIFKIPVQIKGTNEILDFSEFFSKIVEDDQTQHPFARRGLKKCSG